LASIFSRSAVHDCGGSALWAVWSWPHGFGELVGEVVECGSFGGEHEGDPVPDYVGVFFW